MFQKFVSLARQVRRAVVVAAGVGAVTAAVLGLAPAAQAQTASVKIGTAPFISPVAANTWYGTGTTATYSIGTTYVRPNEIKELARALNNDPDQIYDYVRNNIEITWLYGLSKGPVAAITDKSGTAFDQANLMVELLREGGYTANYRVGYITLTPAQFQAWSGIIDAKAACQLLASGGIPGVVNGTTNATCAYTGNLTSIKVAHIWVSVVIGGTTYLFDPAYKPSTQIAGIDLAAAAGMTSGEALTQATSGATTGTDTSTGTSVGFVKELNGAQLDVKVQTYAENIQAYIEANVATGDIDNVIGGQEIERYETPTGGLRQTALPYTVAQQKIWTGRIPDQYRAKLRVEITKFRPSTNLETIIDKTLYADEIGARKLRFNTVYDSNFNLDKNVTFLGSLELADGQENVTSLASFTVTADIMTENPVMSFGELKLTVDPPYATPVSGTTLDGLYMNATKVSAVSYHVPFTIVNSFGAVSPDMVAKWSSRKDRSVPPTPIPDVVGVTPHDRCDNCLSPYVSTAGDGRREQLAIGWMAQSWRAGDIQARMAGSIYQHHYSVGVVSADTQIRMGESGYNGASEVPPWEQANYTRFFFTIDSADRIDVDTAFSLTSKTADANARRPAVHAIAASLEALEGSIAAQQVDMPDTSSVATRFAWGNKPPVAEDPAASSTPIARRFYEFTAANASAASALVKVETLTSTSADGIHSGQTVEIGSTELNSRRTALASAIQAYTTAGYTVVASEEAFLGPGQRAGGFFVPNPDAQASFKHKESKQRGGAFVATRYENGEPVEIANVVVGPDGNFKGGGAGAQLFNQAQYDPATAADVLKSRFVDKSVVLGVDLKTGEVTHTSPAAMSVGSGEFPYKLEAQLIWRGGQQPDPVFNATNDINPGGPWITNWSNSLSLSGSGLEAMGVSDVRSLAGSLAAFLAARDIYAATPSRQRDVAGVLVSSWWVKQLIGNVVTVQVGADSRQFLRKPNGAWLSPGAAQPSTLVMTGARQVVEELPGCDTGLVTVVGTRGYNDAGLGFTVTGPNGDVQNWAYWRTDVPDGQSCSSKVKGFRLTSWQFPQGVSVTLNYQDHVALNGEMPALLSVSNSLGRQINFTKSGLEGFSDSTRTVTIANDSFYNPLVFTHTDAVGSVTKYETFKLPNGDYRLSRIYAPDNMTTPSLEYTYDTLGRVKEARDAIALQVGGRNPYKFQIADGVRGERIDPQVPTGGRYVVMYDRDGRPFRVIDELGRTTSLAHDARGRVVSYTYPEGDQEVLTYDNLNRVTEMRKKAKPGSSLADIVVGASYDANWNKVTSLTDPLGNVTDFTYFNSGNGKSLMATATRPDPDGAGPLTRPVYSFSYNAAGQPLTATDPTNLVVQNTYVGGYLTSTTLDPAGINAVTTMAYNAAGDVVSTDGPRTDVVDLSYVVYDNARRKVFEIGPDPDGAGPLQRPATRITYDPRGLVAQVDKGKSTGTDGSVAGTNFTALETVTNIYDPAGKEVRKNTPEGVTQTAYDAMDRPVCVAVRMNSTVFASLPASACTPSTSGASGLDQIVKTEYDVAGQTLKVVDAYGTPDQRDYATYTYSLNGQQATIVDARGNRSTMEYDGFGRLCRVSFPVTVVGAGQSATPSIACRTTATLANDAMTSGDFEEYRYDAVGQRSWARRRDGQVIAFGYDNLGREILKDIPGGTATDVVTAYDGAGRIKSSLFNGVAGQGTNIVYDTAGRMQTETAFGKTLSYQYDKAGNRIRITWPDAFYVQWNYDALNRPTTVGENGTTAGVGLLATYVYDDLGRRSSLARGNGTTTGYSYDVASRLTGVTHDLSSMTYDQTYAFTYNPGGQILTRTTNNTLYQWTPPPVGTTTSNSYDGLNRDAAAAALSGGYDARGNLGNDGSRTFTYDAENRLTSVGGSVSLALSYDTVGRLQQTVAGSTTVFLYDGSNLIAEYDAAGTLVRRYVHGPNADEPLVWYEGSGTADRRWLHTDWQGSVIAQSNSSGAVTQIYAYGPWGEPKDDVWTGSRFRYTGQTALADVKLYYYKARVYDPHSGRFLQTDPIGYKDDLNLYGYVAGDPINKTDPMGLEVYDCTTASTCPGKMKLADMKVGDTILTKGAVVKITANNGAQVSLRVGYEDGASAAAQGPVLVPKGPDGVSVDRNIRDSRAISAIPGVGVKIWYDLVKNKGKWDYKQRSRLYEPFGNFNFGATGRSLFSPGILLQEAGRAQTKAGSGNPEFGKPGVQLSPWTGTGARGDDPVDQYWIMQGIRYRDERR